MFLIYLVIVPIFFTASALAALTADATGYDGVAGFRRAANDVTILNASASISGKKVSASQLKMLQSPTKPFDCTEGNYSETVNCTMTISGDLYAGANTYDVELFNEDGSSTGERQSVTIYADDLAPKVHSFSMVRNGSAIDAVYQVSDSACDSCGADICAGISKVEFLLDGSDVGSVKGNGSCLMVNQTQLSVKPDNGTTTNKTICIDVYDRVGQHTSSCKSIVMDFTPPALINVSLWLDKNMIRYHKGVPMGGVTVKAYISEDSALNTSTLFANFSELSTRAEFRNAYSDIRMSDLSDKQLFSISCTNASNSSGVYLCTWTGLLIVLEEDTEPTVYLSVYDNLGNVLNTSYQIPVVYDKTAPEITDIRSGIADDRGRYWVGKGNNTIFVDVTETGSGLYDKKLFLDFSSFGPQPDAKNATTLFPNNCTSGWTCVFNNIIVTKNRVVGDALTVNVVGTSSDDAGNIVTGITTAGLYYDDVAPQVLNIINSSICPTAPGTIDLTVNVSEKLSGGVKAKVSAPNLSTSVFPQEVECEESEEAGIWTCDISIDNLVTIYAKDSINITLIDRANNTNTTVIPQEVCESAPGVPPNVVKSYATPIPQVLDKIIAGYIAYPVFAEIDFSYSNPPNQVQDIQISSCTADNATISEPYVVTPLEFRSPIIGMKVELDQQGVENATSLTVYCGLELIIRSGNKVYQQAEEENVSIDLELKGTIFGGLNESMQDKVADIEQQIADKQAEADEYETAIDVLGTICSIAEILAMLTALLQVVKILLYAVGWVVFGVVVIFAGRTAAMTAGSTIYYTGCYIIDYATTIVTTYAWQIDSNPLTAYDSPGFYLKLICAWFTCRLSETNNFIEMFLSSGSADGGDYTFDIDGDRSEGMPNDLESGVLSGSVMPAVGSLW
ncbi:hypothetical protein KY363_00670, partial [Candidatus Woesearchaeota archaeon]|nr:hypothetical protein [Candidatus Woesearchaeota archaeon]